MYSLIMKSVLIFATLLALFHESQPIPLPPEDDSSVQLEYENLKSILISDYGYTREFADLVEVNLKRALEEQQQNRQSINLIDTIPDELPSSTSNVLRQNPNQGSVEYEDDDITTTTPRASAGDIVRGVAQLFAGLGTFNLNTFWGSFVNFFPPGQRQQAQALVDGALGRRPQMWPTTPTTTSSTTMKEEYELESDETTRAAVTAVTALGGVTLAPVIVSSSGSGQQATVASYIPGSIVPPLPPTRATTVKTATLREEDDLDSEETRMRAISEVAAEEATTESTATEEATSESSATEEVTTESTVAPTSAPVSAEETTTKLITAYIPGSESELGK